MNDQVGGMFITLAVTHYMSQWTARDLYVPLRYIGTPAYKKFCFTLVVL